ncbi:M81 family metallopeptidase [Rhizobium puerariae]|uniref:Microcystinase C n=1 Tax=Rhizobium puerariae TaxID=1585791 RepID=A0ABV6AUH9_9HYPH
MRILVACISHETNTFSPVPTPLARFRPGGEQPLRGQPAIEFYSGTQSALGGFLHVAEEAGAEVALAVAASAPPSGPSDAATFEALSGILLQSAREEGPFDAVFLHLHGAMVTEGYEDGEGEILRRLRTVLPDVPLALSLDMHANVFPEMIEHADVVAGYQTYPHLDERETAIRAGRALVRSLRREIRPTLAWGSVPMLPHVMAQGTNRSPNREIQALTIALEESGEAVLASVFVGFPHADISQAGLSAVVVTDDDEEKAQSLVRRLLDAAWATRKEFVFESTPLADSVAQAKSLGAQTGPIVILDHCDNCGSGGTVDTTEVLAEIIRQELKDVIFFGICDPSAVQACVEAGVGATVSIEIGGHTPMPSIPYQSAPLAVTGRVRTLSAGYFRSNSSMHRGIWINIGPMALLDLGGIEVALISTQVEPTDLGLFLALGVDPASKRFIAIKSRVHWAADLGQFAKHVVPCAGVGVCTSDYSILKFKNVRRPIFPLDDIPDPL